MNVKVYGKEYNVRPILGAHDNGIAVQLLYEEDGGWFPFATLTVCLQDREIDHWQAFLDTNNCPWAEEFVVENGLGTPTGEYGMSGYCVYPLYDMDKYALCKFQEG